NLKLLVPIGFCHARCFFLALVELPIPQELLSLGDHGEIRTHTLPPSTSDSAKQASSSGGSSARGKYSRTTHSAARGTASLTAFDNPWEIDSGSGPVWQASTRTSTPQLCCNSRNRFDVGS